MMFKNKQDEDKVCEMLKIFSEEFAPENVVVSLPKVWYKPEYSLHPCTLLFETTDTIELSTYYDAKQGYQFTMQLQEV